MINEAQIVDKLRTIDPYRLERLVTHLLYQGAFSDIVPPNKFLESFGTNPAKQRTTKSPGHADAELRNLGVNIETSANEVWSGKFRGDVEKHVGKEIRVFVFCTNQDTGSNTIKVDGVEVSAEQYCTDRLGCEDCFIIGMKELLYPLQDPRFSNLRRQFLEIPEEHFQTPGLFLQSLRQSPGYQTSIEPSRLQEYSVEVGKVLSFAPNELTILHSNDYIPLLYALGIWAESEAEGPTGNTITTDHCFIHWPEHQAVLQGVDHREMSPEVDSFMYVWGANDTENLSDYSKFCRGRTSVVFVTPTAFKEDVAGRLNSSGAVFSLRDLPLSSLDHRTVELQELRDHEEKLRSFMTAPLDQLERLEALIYFYSPLRLTNESNREKICNLIGIGERRLSQLTDLLLQSDAAAVTGSIIWLREPAVARQLLSDFITNGVFGIESLV